VVSSRLVDLRSDTVTRPSAAMRRAMAAAEVGDDLYGEDPTVRELEEQAAALLGKEAGLFVCSGVMGNQVALRTLTRPGDLVVAGRRQHMVAFEHGAAARNALVQMTGVDDRLGYPAPDEVAAVVAAADHHQPVVGLVAVENSHMAAGGRPVPPEAMAEVVAAAGGCPVHLDGARIFNAAVALGQPAATLAAPATTVMFCLSKGLGAPVGSMLVGSADLIAVARRERSVLGGGMRQAGVLAAAGLVALGGVARLAEDHARAARLRAAVADRWPGTVIDPEGPMTNVVIFPHPAPDRLLAHLAGHGVLAGTVGPGRVRLVTHLDVDDDGVEQACGAIAGAP